MTPMPTDRSSLIDLAARYGVSTDYQDWSGRHVTVPDTTLVAVLGALGVQAGTDAERTDALTAHEAA